MTPYAQKKLDGLVQRTLNDAGLTQPPVCLSDLMEFLDLSQEFYNLSDPGFLDKAKHKITKQLNNKPKTTTSKRTTK